MSSLHSSDFVRQTIQYTHADYEQESEMIAECLKEVGGPLQVFDGFKYHDILYPAEALSILAMSRQMLEHFNPDNLLEAKLAEWLQRNVIDYNQYSLKLFEAIGELGCMEGVYLRANLLIIAPPEPTRVRIAGGNRRRPQVVERVPHKSLGSTQRRRLRDMLVEKKRFDGNLNSVYHRLGRLHTQYNLEQALLSWMGYILMKTAAGKEPSVPRLS